MKRTLIAGLILIALPVLAQTSAPAAGGDPWQAQRQRAEKLRQEADALRRDAQTQRDADDTACYGKFLVNRCLDQSRDRYLEKVNGARGQEVEAANLEREAKSHELAVKDAERAAHPVQSSGRPLTPDASAPHAGPQPTARPLPARPVAPHAPAPTAAPIDAQEQAEHDAARRAQRSQQEADAAKRAQQAREDKARYDARAKAAAEKKAQRQQQSAPAAQ
jgi:colicin import membrane protein